jgi:hypothetical protein
MLSFRHVLVSERVWEGQPDVVKTAVKGDLRMPAATCRPKLSPALRFFAYNVFKT